MKTIKFTLTMPNNNSWNGRWTGEENLYVKFRKVPNQKIDDLGIQKPNMHVSKNFYYDFGDGWGANVRVCVSDYKEKNKLQKKSSGFCGYDWMIDSILSHGKILNTAQRERLIKSKKTMKKLQEIIKLEVLGEWETSYDMALNASRQTWALYQEYLDFNEGLEHLLNRNFIV